MNTVHEGRSHLDWISDRISGVLDPLAMDHQGWPEETIRPLVAKAWRREFGGALNDSALADTAAAIHDGRPWSDALWTDGRYR